MVDTATPALQGAPVVPPTAVAPENKSWLVSNDEVNASIGAKPILPAQADVPKPSEPGAPGGTAKEPNTNLAPSSWKPMSPTAA